MGADYVKVYSGFFQGSLRDQPPFARLLFLAMLTKADENGVCLGAPSFWSAYVGITVDEVRASLAILAAPDPESTTPDEDGRRIIPWGEGANQWRIVNYRKYYERSRSEDRKEYKRQWDRDHADTRNWRSDPNNRRPTQSDKSDTSDPEQNTITKGTNIGAKAPIPPRGANHAYDPIQRVLLQVAAVLEWSEPKPSDIQAQLRVDAAVPTLIDEYGEDGAIEMFLFANDTWTPKRPTWAAVCRNRNQLWDEMTAHRVDTGRKPTNGHIPQARRLTAEEIENIKR